MLWTLLFLGPLVELGAGLLVARSPRRDALALLLFLPLFLISIALCTKAWLDGVIGPSVQLGEDTACRRPGVEQPA